MPQQMDQSKWRETAARFSQLFAARTRDEWCAIFDGTTPASPGAQPGRVPTRIRKPRRRPHRRPQGKLEPAPAPRCRARRATEPGPCPASASTAAPPCRVRLLSRRNRAAQRSRIRCVEGLALECGGFHRFGVGMRAGSINSDLDLPPAHPTAAASAALQRRAMVTGVVRPVHSPADGCEGDSQSGPAEIQDLIEAGRPLLYLKSSEEACPAASVDAREHLSARRSRSSPGAHRRMPDRTAHRWAKLPSIRARRSTGSSPTRSRRSFICATFTTL